MIAQPSRHKSVLHSQSLGSGPTIVLLHGWGMHSEMWGSFRELLALHFRVVTIDLPGCGGSHAVTWQDELETIIDQLVAACAEPAIWLGWSLGGLLTTTIAVRYPELVRRLILVASNPCFVANENWPGITLETLQDFQRQLLHDTEKTLLQFFQLQCLGLPHAQATLKQLQQANQQAPRPNSQALLGGMKTLATVDHRVTLSQLTQPCLMIWGKNDRIVPVAAQAAIQQLAPKITHHTIAHAAHMPFYTHTLSCYDTIRAWCS